MLISQKKRYSCYKKVSSVEQEVNTHRAGAGAAGAVKDPAGLVLLPRRLEMPAGGRAGADAGRRAAVSGHRVAVLVHAVCRLTVLALVLHLAQTLH